MDAEKAYEIYKKAQVSKADRCGLSECNYKVGDMIPRSYWTILHERHTRIQLE